MTTNARKPNESVDAMLARFQRESDAAAADRRARYAAQRVVQDEQAGRREPEWSSQD